ncbi:PREDICTED: uncharacterized protein LOC105121163 isoform X4 [Populus euphratica]|uniref:Uncharacterized protein LOC105121163 isoform X4 n=1 Tax=Populus euphratica TaxID=75702 RepID=A0AAJ6XGQ1_POPEU|nr:PREDICTED: uncharacterized protein LOC105121163 isoform X4 [Populus euphratica]
MEREDKELEDEIKVAGNALLSPPSSVSQLLLLLEKLENCLMRMDQSPSNSMQRAADLAMKALMNKELLSHSDVDVKVSVALCFSQILRITAPIFSYDDEQMQVILQLIVASFENISDTSSPSYHKRVLILEKFANVRSCLLMVDRKCYSLIMEMFKHFLTNIREHHPDIVFSSMGLIMIIILDEIKEIPLEIVNLFLDFIRNRNQDVLPIAQKLGERIFENCGSKLAPYVPQANYCGQKRSRDKLQDSRSHTEVALVVKKENDGKEGCGYQGFEEENREEDKNTKEKDFKEKILQEEDENFQREVMKQKRSRKLVKPNNKPVVKEKNDGEEGSKKQVFGEENSGEGRKEKIDRGEGCKEQGFQEEYHNKEGKKIRRKAFNKKKRQKEGIVFQGEETVKEKGTRERVREDQIVSIPIDRRKLKYEGKQAMDTKCSARKMHEFLSNLKGKKRSIIENSIFSAYLDIPRCPINRNLAAALIECYDAKMDAFIVAGRPLKFCGKEIEKCIGLRFEGKRVDMKFLGAQISPQIVQRYFEIVSGNERTKKKSTGASKEMKDGEMRSSMKKSSCLLLQKLNLMRVDGKDEAEDFLRLSIVYMFNVYFFPTHSKYISWWPLKFLENLNDFDSYAWGRAVYDYLLTSLEKAARKLAGQDKFYAILNGCVPLLQTLASDRISKLQVLDLSTNPNPSVLYYNMDGRSFDAFQKVLANLQPDEIKECKECEVVVKSSKAKVKSTEGQKMSRGRKEKETGAKKKR